MPPLILNLEVQADKRVQTEGVQADNLVFESHNLNRQRIYLVIRGI